MPCAMLMTSAWTIFAAGHRLKHIMILVIVFVLGYACGKIFCFCPMRKQMPYSNHPVFVNGCLDTQRIQNTKFQEMLLKADVNEDGCISMEEYKAFKAKCTDKKKTNFNMKHKMNGQKNAQ